MKKYLFDKIKKTLKVSKQQDQDTILNAIQSDDFHKLQTRWFAPSDNKKYSL